MTSATSSALTDTVASVLCRDVAWQTLSATADTFWDACEMHGTLHLLSERIRRKAVGADWPHEFQQTVLRNSRAALATELAVAADLTKAVDALQAVGVTPIFFKGAALAYSVYDSPELRPRSDSDVLIREQDYAIAREILVSLGYTETLTCEELFGQVRFQRITSLGITHAIDVHWRISTQSLFADLVSYDEMAASSIPLRLPGSCVRGAGLVQALLLACVHPVMHHRNEEVLIWLYDVHLLAQLLSDDDWRRFASLARARGVRAICAEQLARASQRFGTCVPETVAADLNRIEDREATSAYLAKGRGWRHEFAANVAATRGAAARIKLLREVLIPGRDYMLRAYGVTRTPWATLLLPALHIHRLVRGAARVVTGAK